MASEVAMLSCPAKAGVRVRRRSENQRFAWGAAAFAKAGQTKANEWSAWSPAEAFGRIGAVPHAIAHDARFAATTGSWSAPKAQNITS